MAQGLVSHLRNRSPRMSVEDLDSKRQSATDPTEMLAELDGDYLNRLLLLFKTVEQRAQMLSAEIARVMARMGFPPNSTGD